MSPKEEESGESSSVITVQNLEPGDHIFSERKRSGYSYSHHGIYVGHNAVIHLQGPHKYLKTDSADPCRACGYQPRREGTVVKTCLSCFSAGSSSLSIRLCAVHVTRNKIENWILDKITAETLVYVFDQNGGVDFGIWAHGLLHRFQDYGHDTGRLERCLRARVTSRRDRRVCQARCLDCFLGDDGGLLYIHEKRVQGEWRDAISRQADAMDAADHQRFFVESSGSKRVQICKLTSKKTPEKVVDTAVQLLEKGYSNYHLIRNNCEHFAVHCKTGLAMSIQVEAFGLGRAMDRMLRAAVRGYVPTLEDRMDHGHCKMNQMKVRNAETVWLKRLRLRVCTALKKNLLFISPTKTTSSKFDFSHEDIRLDEFLCQAGIRWKKAELDEIDVFNWTESDFEEFMVESDSEEVMRH